MSAKRKIIIIAFVMIAVLAGAWNLIPRKAPPASLPDSDDVSGVSVKHENNAFGIISNLSMRKELLDQLNKAEPTRIQSVNDEPSVDDYYKIAIETNDGDVTYAYIYEEDATLYFEQPYQGVYVISDKEKVMDIIHGMGL